MTDIMVETVDFVQRRESSAVKQALQAVTALRDALALKREIGLPVLPETRSAIEELENQIVALKLQLLRSHHPDQMVLPGMEDLAKNAKDEANDDTASCPAPLVDVLGS